MFKKTVAIFAIVFCVLLLIGCTQKTNNDNELYVIDCSTNIVGANIELKIWNQEYFENKIKNGGFLEYTYFCGHYYGTPLDKVEEALDSGKELILEIEVNGCRQVKEKMIDAVTIFIVPPSKEALYERLKKRGTESDYQIQERIAKANSEFPLAYQYDYIVVNDSIENAADRIRAIIRAEHAKTSRSIYKYYEMLGDTETHGQE